MGHKLIIDNCNIECPIKKDSGFPCPRCAYSVSTSETKAFLNTTTWWYCEYPDVKDFSKLQDHEIALMLKTKYQDQGYSLSKDEDYVYLRRNGKICRVFSYYKMSITTVEKYLENNA
jgi:hypothetical protein